jgi:hypothetical protein
MDRRDRTIAGLLGTGLFAFYVTVQFGDFWGWDGRTMATVTHSIADHHTIGLPPTSPGGSTSSPVTPNRPSPFGIGLSLAGGSGIRAHGPLVPSSAMNERAQATGARGRSAALTAATALSR